jgi:hypothetical protein
LVEAGFNVKVFDWKPRNVKFDTLLKNDEVRIIGVKEFFGCFDTEKRDELLAKVDHLHKFLQDYIDLIQ